MQIRQKQTLQTSSFLHERISIKHRSFSRESLQLKMASFATSNKSDSDTPCARECKSQQDILVECVESIRRANEDNAVNSEDGMSSHDGRPSSCLTVAVEAWAQCCADANRKALSDTPNAD